MASIARPKGMPWDTYRQAIRGQSLAGVRENDGDPLISAFRISLPMLAVGRRRHEQQLPWLHHFQPVPASLGNDEGMPGIDV
ncbi:hypothetical protein, partial [Stenotrophomonas maltophilia]|uniref:hypothetical protein n=1 Tax=Stenotrophomonas maltophilia TaxID=40324 RepID=UPI001952C5CC